MTRTNVSTSEQPLRFSRSLARLELAGAAFFLGVGLAGLPLEPLRLLAALLVCGAIVYSGKFIAAAALVATIAAGWLQHGELRLTLLVAAALLGIAVRFTSTHAKTTTALAAACAVIGAAFLFRG